MLIHDFTYYISNPSYITTKLKSWRHFRHEPELRWLRWPADDTTTAATAAGSDGPAAKHVSESAADDGCAKSAADDERPESAADDGRSAQPGVYAAAANAAGYYKTALHAGSLFNFLHYIVSLINELLYINFEFNLIYF